MVDVGPEEDIVRKRIATLAASVVAAAVLAMAGAPGAQAVGGTHTHNNYYSYSMLKTTPHVSGGLVIANMSNDSAVAMVCWVDTENVTNRSYSNYNSPRWFKVFFGSQLGYVHSSYVYNQVGVGRC